MSDAAKRNVRTLVVDRNSDFAAGFAFMLEGLGYEARFLLDSTHTLTKVDEFRPHVAFVDIGMPSADGLNLAKVLRDHYARHEVRLVALSLYGDERLRDASSTSGFDAHLVKPVSPHDVETILDLVLDKRLR